VHFACRRNHESIIHWYNFLLALIDVDLI